MSGNRSSKTTLLDEIDDPHGDYVRAGASGYDQGPAYPWTKEDVRRYVNQVKELESGIAHPERGSPSSISLQVPSISPPPAGTKENERKDERGVNERKPRKIKKKRNLVETDGEEDREDLSDRMKRSAKKKSKTTLVIKISLSSSLHDLDLVGIDTCSAVSVSTEKEDFIFIDE